MELYGWIDEEELKEKMKRKKKEKELKEKEKRWGLLNKFEFVKSNNNVKVELLNENI